MGIGWVEIPGFEGFYKISSEGVVRNTKTGKTRKLSKNGNGYLKINLSRNGLKKTFLHHRLVAICFIPREEGKKVVNHINGDRSDNRIENLEWVTQRENITHSKKKNQGNSQYVGVCWHKTAKKWQAQLTVNGKPCYIGSYTTEIEANANVISFMQEHNIYNRYA